MRRINLLHAHGSPTRPLYKVGCRCASCRGAEAERKLAHNEAHRDETREAAKRQRARNPEAVRDYARRYKAENRERTSTYYRQWAAANPDKVRDHWTAQRARRAQAEGDHTAADLLAQYTRQKGRCFYCKTRLGDNYHDEHVTPIILGGSNGLENIVAACPTCNQRKAAKHPMDFAGLLC